VSKTCKNPFSCEPSRDCPKFTAGTSTEDAKLECEGGKWLINNAYYEDIHPVCKDDEMNENSGAFYMNYTDGRLSKLTEGKCFQDYDCQKKTKLDISPEIIIKDGTISCAEGDMRVQYGNITYDEKQYKCNNSRGIWISNSGKMIKENSRVMCIKQAPLGIEAYSTGEFAGYLSAIALCTIAFVALVTGAFLCCNARKDHICAVWSTKTWIFKPSRMKLASARDVFHKASQATPTSMAKIIDGLKLIKRMLKSETEDPEIWELAWPFLDRLHGSS
ncbi:hypothetical protein PFISCL1PPCAC_7864, partial [Pristionchus fissidentatus]